MAGTKGKSGGARLNSGGVRAGAGRPAGVQNRATRAANEAARSLPHATDPMAWLTAVMVDSNQGVRLRIEAAKALLPYVHAKRAEGVKAEKQEAAKKAGAGRFASSVPPVRLIT